MASASSNRKTVLFVDDDAEFLAVLQAHMELLSGATWEVIVADNSAGALALLDSRTIDLAVLDVQMPVVDGMQLLQLLNRKRPQLKKAVLTAHFDESVRAMAFNSGAELMLQKPLDPAGYEALYAALNELVQLPSEQGFRGVLRRVCLEDIIQMECLSRHSLVLEVVARGRRGRVYICEGALVHAESGDLTGEPALQELLTLRGGEFHHRSFTAPPRETLEGSWEFLLMEAARKRDETVAGAEAGTVEEPAAPPPAAPAPAPAPAPEAEQPVINELVVCSEEGEPLYASAAQALARCQLCMAVVESGALLRRLLPLGDLERIEFMSVPGRMLVRLQEGKTIFLHANRE